MKLGLFSNPQRHMTDVTQSWNLDMREVVAADRLGFEEAWISEHNGMSFLPDGLPMPEMFIAKAAALTKNLRFGTAVRRIALYQPYQIAMEAAVTDHLTDGRYIFGFGSGGPLAGYEQRGIDFADAAEIMQESIDFIERCWAESEPFTHDGKFFKGQDILLYPKPLQKPGLPVAIATGQPEWLARAAKRGYRVLTSQFSTPAQIRKIGDAFEAACEAVGRKNARADVTAVRSIYVADTDERAMREIERGWEDHLDFTKRNLAFSLGAWAPESGDVQDLTFRGIEKAGLAFVGSPETVAQRVRQFHQDSGGFGRLLLVGGRSWATPEQCEHSFELFSRKVLPLLTDL